MDIDVSGWIIEYLLRQTEIPDKTINNVISLLYSSSPNNFNYSLTKSFILRQIFNLSKTSPLPHSIIKLLEQIEELDFRAGVSPTIALQTAYCQVAVDCTVRLEASEYFEEVKRIWRGRVAKMKDSDCGLVSEELMEWMEEIETAVYDSQVEERVKGRWREMDVVAAVRDYVADAWERLGPTFLEEVAELAVRDGAVADVLGLADIEEGCRTSEVQQEGIAGDDEATMDTGTTREVLGIGDNGVTPEQKVTNNENNVPATENNETRMEVLGSEEDQVPLRHLIIDNVTNVPATGNNETSREVLGSDENHIIDNVTNLSHNGTRMTRRKHVAKKRSRRSVTGTSTGAKITDTEQVGEEELSNRYGCIPSPEINKVQEALKTSSLELQASVTDPLPEALELAKNGGSMVYLDSSNLEDLANATDAERPCTSLENNVPKPSLMTRNTSAHTYEWDDSIDDLPKGDTSPERRIKLPSPKNRAVSPLKIHQMSNIKKTKHKKWTTLEEETLRAGVEKYGRGCWKAILNAYSDIFEDRTVVDLKDKWRNMTRYTH